MEANDAAAKATDENLTSENWEFILDVCDKVNAKPEDGCLPLPGTSRCRNANSTCRPKDAVAAITKRLAYRNANVQLYSLLVRNVLRCSPDAAACGFT